MYAPSFCGQLAEDAGIVEIEGDGLLSTEEVLLGEMLEEAAELVTIPEDDAPDEPLVEATADDEGLEDVVEVERGETWSEDDEKPVGATPF